MLNPGYGFADVILGLGALFVVIAVFRSGKRR